MVIVVILHDGHFQQGRFDCHHNPLHLTSLHSTRPEQYSTLLQNTSTGRLGSVRPFSDSSISFDFIFESPVEERHIEPGCTQIPHSHAHLFSVVVLRHTCDALRTLSALFLTVDRFVHMLKMPQMSLCSGMGLDIPQKHREPPRVIREMRLGLDISHDVTRTDSERSSAGTRVEE